MYAIALISLNINSDVNERSTMRNLIDWNKIN